MKSNTTKRLPGDLEMKGWQTPLGEALQWLDELRVYAEISWEAEGVQRAISFTGITFPYSTVYAKFSHRA